MLRNKNFSRRLSMINEMKIDEMNRERLHMRQSSAWFGSSVKRISLLGLTLIAVAVSGLAIVRQSSETKPAQAQEAKAKPGAAEMKRLGFYPGQWTYTETYPNGAVNQGVYTSKPGPGGNSLLNTFHSQGPVGDFEGMLVYTWDLAEGKYKAYVFGGDFPGALVETGEFEGEKLVFHGEIGAGAGKVQLRNVSWMASPGKLVSETYMSRAGAPEKLMVRVEASKQ
jgi:hypothetical protein